MFKWEGTKEGVRGKERRGKKEQKETGSGGSREGSGRKSSSKIHHVEAQVPRDECHQSVYLRCTNEKQTFKLVCWGFGDLLPQTKAGSTVTFWKSQSSDSWFCNNTQWDTKKNMVCFLKYRSSYTWTVCQIPVFKMLPQKWLFFQAVVGRTELTLTLERSNSYERWQVYQKGSFWTWQILRDLFWVPFL